MAYTYSKIATVTVGSGGSSSIDFLAIPQNYTDLVLKISARDSRNTTSYETNFTITFNYVNSNKTSRYIYGQSATVTSGNVGDIQINSWNTGTTGTQANVFSNIELYIPNYSSNNYKSISADAVAEGNIGNGPIISLTAGLWSNSNSINAISISSGYTITQYSTATLYGIKAEV